MNQTHSTSRLKQGITMFRSTFLMGALVGMLGSPNRRRSWGDHGKRGGTVHWLAMSYGGSETDRSLK